MRKIFILLLTCFSLAAFAAPPMLQVINVSGDSIMQYCKVEVGGQLVEDSLAFNGATAYLPVGSGTAETIRFTSLEDNAEFFELTNLTLTDDNYYQSILFGVRNPGDYASNPEGQSTALDATFQTVDRSGISAGNVRTNFFHAVSDAIELDVADLIFEFVVNDMNFGTYGSSTTDFPMGNRSLFFTSTDSLIVVGSRSAGLDTANGKTATILLSGFIVPINNQNGPSINFYAVDEAGNVVEMGFVLRTPIQELLQGLNLYPNPATDHVRLEFTLKESTEIRMAVTDLAGNELSVEILQGWSGYNNIRTELPQLANGIYFVHLSRQGAQMALPLIIVK